LIIAGLCSPNLEGYRAQEQHSIYRAIV